MSLVDERWFHHVVLENFQFRCQGYFENWNIELHGDPFSGYYEVRATGIDDCGLHFEHVMQTEDPRSLTHPASKEWNELAGQLISKKRAFDEDRTLNLTP